jgi:hypothetical protein
MPLPGTLEAHNRHTIISVAVIEFISCRPIASRQLQNAGYRQLADHASSQMVLKSVPMPLTQYASVGNLDHSVFSENSL